MKSQSVMIIDDNEIDRFLLKRLLKMAKISEDVFEAGNGKAALDLFSNLDESLKLYPQSFPPTIVFIDLNMPIMDGFEFLEKFSILRKENAQLQSVLFAVFSTSELEADKIKVEHYDFVKGFISKGDFSANNLKETLRKTFSNLSL